MLKQRIITALVLLPLALAGFLGLDGGAFALFVALVVVLGAWEWARLAGLLAQPLRLCYAAVSALLLYLLYLMPAIIPWVLGLAVLWWILAAVLVLSYPRCSRYWGGLAGRLLMGLLILLPAWQGLLLLKQWPQANELILAVMLLVWAADIGAYFSGRRFGKRKLAPQVSPGKSWEGLLGGLVLSVALCALVGAWRGWSSFTFALAIPAAALLVVVSVIGDLTESMFKRQSGFKDSSNLLPGHGGVLDRIDSLCAAVPIFAVMLWLSGWSVL
jgi:phosphatidate cytidylyltransferase